MKKIICNFMIIGFLVVIGTLLMPHAKMQLEVIKKPAFIHVDEFWYVYTEWTCPRGQMGEKANIQRAEMKKQNIEGEWVFLIFYDWPKTDEGQLHWARGVVVPKDTPCKSPLKKAKFDKTEVVAYTLTGDLTIKDISAGNHHTTDWIEEHGYTRLWPSYEIYHTEPPEFHLWYLVKK